jgi:S1-C subfamily serine protease
VRIIVQSALRPVALGESKGLKVGQQVLAIGNPFGFDHTLTTGAH